MTELHLPWTELCVLIPLLGAVLVGRQKNRDVARKWSTVIAGITLACTLGAMVDFLSQGASVARDAWDVPWQLLGRNILVIDQLSAPLLPLTALLYLLTAFATLRTKIRRFSFAWTLASEAILLATFCCQDPWLLIFLLALGVVPPYIELANRGKSTRVFSLHMALFVFLLVFGWSFADPGAIGQEQELWAAIPLLAAILIRGGIVPVHCWVSDLFENATFGTALLFVTPIPAAYAAVRLVLPICPDWVLHIIGLISIITAVYAAGMALVQREARRFFCYLFLSHSALVFVGLESVTVIGLTGALCMWLSIGISMCGFGLTLRALEARRGRLSLTTFQGVYEHTPALAVCFLLTGLASVGFPATFGFMGAELLVDGAVQAFPYVGIAVVVAGAINGIAVVQAYFLLFTGTRYASSVSLQIGVRERFAVLALAILILGFGLWPQPIVGSRFKAAQQILSSRQALLPSAPEGSGELEQAQARAIPSPAR